MTDFYQYESNDHGDWGIETRKKFPSGVTGILQFEFMEELGDGTASYNVSLELRRKRKRAPEHLEVTGRDGLEPASWALQALSEFEQHPGHERPIRIEVFGEDNRRWKLYEKILTKRGYSVTMIENQRTLVKRIEGRE